MSAKLWLIVLICYQALLNSVQGKCFFGVGQRIIGDQLLLKDVQHSRPGSSSEQPSVVFNYEIPEPITYIQIVSEENISAEVKFSYVNQLVVGMVTILPTNDSAAVTSAPSIGNGFDVLITIYGFNDTMLNANPALLLNTDQQFEGPMEPYDSAEYIVDSEEQGETYANAEREVLEVDLDDVTQAVDELEEEEDKTLLSSEFEGRDKIIEVGKRQPDDHLVYETYQTSPDVAGVENTNLTVVFYYVDSDYITYVKFVIFDYFVEKFSSAADYQAPLAEYTHYSANTLKATITVFNKTTVFVQMFIYGYKSKQVPSSFEPFLPPPHWQRPSLPGADDKPSLTPMQRLQLLLLTGQATTVATDSAEDVDNDNDDETKPLTINAEDMGFDQENSLMGSRSAVATDNAVQELMDRRMWAFVGMLLLLLHN